MGWKETVSQNSLARLKTAHHHGPVRCFTRRTLGSPFAPPGIDDSQGFQPLFNRATPIEAIAERPTPFHDCPITQFVIGHSVTKPLKNSMVRTLLTQFSGEWGDFSYRDCGEAGESLFTYQTAWSKNRLPREEIGLASRTLTTVPNKG